MDPDPTSRRAGRVAIDLTLDDPTWRADLPDAAELACRACRAALDAASPGPPLAVALVLADDGRLRELNRRWRGIDRPTNVLSFPTEQRLAGEAPRPAAGAPQALPIELGDVVVARQTVLREAAEQAKAPADHLCHLVVHGTLHLLGFDHGSEAEAEAMEALERRVLASMGVADPYAEAS